MHHRPSFLAPFVERAALRLGAVALGAALTFSAAPARAAPPEPQVKAPPEDPERYNDPTYKPAEHGGLSYVSYLRMTRGTARRSTGMMIMGIVLSGLSATVLGVGMGVYVNGNSCRSDAPILRDDFFGGSCSGHAAHTTGMAMLLSGTIGAAIGVSMWVVGGTHVPWLDVAGQGHRAPPRWLALVPSVSPSVVDRSRGVGLTWQF